MIIIDWVNMCILVLGVIASVVSLIVGMVKAKRAGAKVNMMCLIEKIPSLVTVAETIFGKGNGIAKLQYVVTQLKMVALQNGIAIEDEELTRQVNNVVLATKYVNVDNVSNSDEQATNETVKQDDVPSAINNNRVVEDSTNDTQIFGE